MESSVNTSVYSDSYGIIKENNKINFAIDKGNNIAIVFNLKFDQ